jgi:nicotinate-nucleotide pyrophosphorylase (carboxylating)
MLDNMPPKTLEEAVEITGGKGSSGSLRRHRADTVKAVAEAGVDLISSGWITHSAPVLDLGLDIEIS